MNLFLFLVGGTGARVLKPLVMQLAAGVRPCDENTGAPIADLQIIPIIMDPHRANEDLKRTEDLLRWYKEIRRSLYGERTDVDHGFFNVKISTLADLIPQKGLNNSFVFNLGSIAEKEFKDYIAYDTLNDANQALCSMLFSKDQLNTKMDIGFVGSPNIGAVALNQFKDSVEFREFANIYKREDRIFVVSSIFGGTGAAGFPIIVKNIRDAASNPMLTNRGDLRDAKIGALTVLPYFNVASDENSPITRADFVIKTKSALYYYQENLTGPKSLALNACYYLGDEEASVPYPNDPGGDGQRNDAHFIEYVGALSILDFISIPNDKLMTIDGKAQNPLFREYGLKYDEKNLTLMTFGQKTRNLVNQSLVKFHLLYMYLTNQFMKDIGRGYTLDAPELRSSFTSTSFYRTLINEFFHSYYDWLMEMQSNNRSFAPFNILTLKLENCIVGIPPKKGLFKGVIDYKTVLSAMNAESKKATTQSRYSSNQLPFKLMDLFDSVAEKIIAKKFNSIK
ncbi:MAG: hypothetical protein K5874_09690 [Bacteroidaceae bacterium]|nr:hypothetical protein [Bacteroidaceae bacterium]